MTFKLGDWVTFTHVLYRCKHREWVMGKPHPDYLERIAKFEHRISVGRSYIGERYWIETPFEMEGLVTPGLIIGKRTLSDGVVIYRGDDGASYEPLRHFTAWKVAHNIHQAPVLVLSPTPRGEAR